MITPAETSGEWRVIFYVQAINLHGKALIPA
jgi:hypothetical protein